jgi:hypothetical protein
MAAENTMAEQIRREAAHIGLSCYRLTLEARERIELPRMNKGITLRGAFGTVFRRLVCHDTKSECMGCMVHETCPYAAVFAPVVPPDSGRLRLNRDIPRPFVIKPPLDGEGVYRSGESFSFDLVVVGDACNFLPYFIVTFEELGRSGIGVRRGRFTLASIQAMAADGRFMDVYKARDRIVRPPPELFLPGKVPPEPGEVQDVLKLTFNTPVLLKERGQWVKPGFAVLVKRLRDRLSALSYFYCGRVMDLDFKKMGEAAERVHAVDSDLHWVEESRYARHRDVRHLLKGYVGGVTYQGDIGPFMPLIRLGEFVHVGKATAFGQGWYRIGTASTK